MKKILTIGTRGFASRDLESFVHLIPRGTPVTITGIDKILGRGYELTDDKGRTVTETGFNSIVLSQEELQMPKRLPIGTKGYAAYDLESLAHFIPEGTPVTITGIDNILGRGYELTDDKGHVVSEAGFNCIIPL